MNEAELYSWASKLTTADLESIMDKVKEYGAIDLELMGAGLADMAHYRPIEGTDYDLSIGLEIAVVFYLQGKIARAVSAIAAGHRPSDDTRKDIRVYAVMWEHICQFGNWRVDPGPSKGDALKKGGMLDNIIHTKET